MSKQAHKDLVSRFSNQFKNEGRHGVVEELMSPDFVHHFKDPNLPPGRAGLAALGAAVSGAFPDVKVEIQDLLADGDRVVERCVATATHSGPFNGVPATGRSVTWTETHIYRVRDGRIAELWPEVDMLSILMQIGAMG